MAGIINDPYKVGGVPQSASRHVAMSTCFDVQLNGTNIGFITTITLGHNRTVTQVRHLNSADAGIAVDTVLTPDVVSLNFGGFYIYSNKTNANGTFDSSTTNNGTGNEVGATAGRMSGVSMLMTLDQQAIPFDIVVKHADGNTSGATNTIIGVYKNCTIASMSVPINIGSAGISDTGNISVGYVANGR